MITKSGFQVIPCTENGDNRKDVEKSGTKKSKPEKKKTTFFILVIL